MSKLSSPSGKRHGWRGCYRFYQHRPLGLKLVSKTGGSVLRSTLKGASSRKQKKITLAGESNEQD